MVYSQQRNIFVKRDVKLTEPPDAEPHVRWCERSAAKAASYSIMAHAMDIKIIAEGAETKEQVEFLRDNGCDYIQGYYFYKPMPEEEFVKLLDAGR